VHQSTNHRRSREIFGQNFFGFEEWAEFYGIPFTKEQFRSRATLPWIERELTAPCPFTHCKRVSETHFAFLGLGCISGDPLTILKLHELHPAPGKPCFFTYQRPAYPPTEFENRATCEFRWYLMPLAAVPGTTGKRYRDQVALLPSGYEVPRAVTEVMKVVLFYKKNGVYLDHAVSARCRDARFDGRPVHVGVGEGGISIGGWWENKPPRFDIGLAAERKLLR
jgi:hypothetical protein